MRIGKVKLKAEFEYVVDLDNPLMVENAETSICEDLHDLYQEMGSAGFSELLVQEEDPSLQYDDVPNFLKEICDGDTEEVLPPDYQPGFPG